MAFNVPLQAYHLRDDESNEEQHFDKRLTLYPGLENLGLRTQTPVLKKLDSDSRT